MFANWIECQSSTGGSGNLTLVAQSPGPSPTNVWGSSGTRRVAYLICEIQDNYIVPPTQGEAGFGDLNLATMVLTRTRVTSCWSFGYYKVNPPNVGFTSGNAARLRVFIGAVAEINADSIHAMYTTNENLGLIGLNQVLANGTIALTASREYYVPFWWAGARDVTQVGIACTTLAASSTVKAAIYEIASNGGPGLQLLDITSSSTFSTASTGIKTISVSIFLPPGWYYMALLPSGTPTLRATDARCYPTPAGTSGTGRATTHLYRAGTYSTGLPSDASGLSLTAQIATATPAVYLKAR